MGQASGQQGRRETLVSVAKAWASCVGSASCTANYDGEEEEEDKERHFSQHQTAMLSAFLKASSLDFHGPGLWLRFSAPVQAQSTAGSLRSAVRLEFSGFFYRTLSNPNSIKFSYPSLDQNRPCQSPR